MSEKLQNTSDEISLKDLIQNIGKWWNFLKTKWLKIALVGFIGGCIGFMHAWMQPVTYIAKLTFVVEEGKNGSSGLGGLASLAGQFGVDVGGNGGGGILSGDNILLYFKSESLAKEVLLSKFDSLSNKSIADVYADVYGLKKKWANNDNIGKVDFPPFSSNNILYSRLQDSLIQSITANILKTQFAVAKTDKKAGFIEVSTKMENEVLAKLYCERIVRVAVDQYVNIKTKRQKATVDKLQARVDSVANLLGKKTVSSAALQTSSSTMDINPLYKTGTAVAFETTVRDKTMLVTIFTSIVQNLELAKFTLSQETPVIQVVDASGYPLKKEKMSKVRTAIIFSIIFGILFVIVLVCKRIFRAALEV